MTRLHCETKGAESESTATEGHHEVVWCQELEF